MISSEFLTNLFPITILVIFGSGCTQHGLGVEWSANQWLTLAVTTRMN